VDSAEIPPGLPDEVASRGDSRLPAQIRMDRLVVSRAKATAEAPVNRIGAPVISRWVNRACNLDGPMVKVLNLVSGDGKWDPNNGSGFNQGGDPRDY
jgi:hypothetical protein